MSAHCQKATDDMLKETVQFFWVGKHLCSLMVETIYSDLLDGS